MQMTRSKQSSHFLERLKYKLNLHSGAQKTCSCCIRFYSMRRDENIIFWLEQMTDLLSISYAKTRLTARLQLYFLLNYLWYICVCRLGTSHLEEWWGRMFSEHNYQRIWVNHLNVSKTEVSLLRMRTNSTKSSISWFLRKGNDYIIIHLNQWRERCEITQNIDRAEGFSQGTEDHRRGKGIFYERIIDQVGSVWILTQITPKGW